MTLRIAWIAVIIGICLPALPLHAATRIEKAKKKDGEHQPTQHITLDTGWKAPSLGSGEPTIEHRSGRDVWLGTCLGSQTDAGLACPDDGLLVSGQPTGSEVSVTPTLSYHASGPTQVRIALQLLSSSVPAPRVIDSAPPQILPSIMLAPGKYFVQVTLVAGNTSLDDTDFPSGETENYHLTVTLGAAGAPVTTLTPQAPWQPGGQPRTNRATPVSAGASTRPGLGR